MSLRIIAEQIGSGASVEAAFKAAFNIELGSFYQQFEAWRGEILSNPEAAFQNRPDLVNLDDELIFSGPADNLVFGKGEGGPERFGQGTEVVFFVP